MIVRAGASHSLPVSDQPGIGVWAAGADPHECLTSLYHLEYLAQTNLVVAADPSPSAGPTIAADFAAAMPGMTATQRTYQIKKLVERKMLQPIQSGARQYTLGFSNNYLMRGIIRALSEEGFIPQTLRPVP